MEQFPYALPVTRANGNLKLLVPVILCKFEFQVAYCDRELRISERFESIGTYRCSVLFKQKR